MTGPGVPDAPVWNLPSADPDPVVWPTGRLLSTAARLVEHAWNQTLADVGMTHAGMLVLHRLEQGPASQREVARTQGVQEQTIARTIAHLEQGGYVERQVDPTDRRRRVVQISSAGRQVLGRLYGHEAAVTDDSLHYLGRDVDELRRSLAALVVSLSEKRWPTYPDLD